MSFPFRRVALVGFGLMAGSLARALKALPDPPHLLGFSDDPGELKAGIEAGLLDSVSGPGTLLLEDRDLVVYGTPPGVTLELIGEHVPFLGPQTVLSDLVSLKAPLLARAREVGVEDRFVGSHPMVGGTGSGFSHASDGLFQGARVWVTPGGASPEYVGRIESLWEGIGAHPVRIDAEAHDEMMAWVSHLPQLTSNALAVALKEAGFGPGKLGPGGRDMTRLAGSGAEMWREILKLGPEALLAGLEAVEGELGTIRTLLAAGRVEEVAALMRGTGKWLEEEDS